MRKLLCLLVVGLVMIPAAASATTRTDPNDTPIVLDIAQVTTERQGWRTFFGIKSYDVWEPQALWENFYSIALDTKPGGDFHSQDFGLGFGYNRFKGTLHCTLIETTSPYSHTIGNRRADWGPEGGVSCAIPTNWLKIRKEVHLIAGAWWQGQHVDRAPNQGRYTGL
jgi:hypothetical protein